MNTITEELREMIDNESYRNLELHIITLENKELFQGWFNHEYIFLNSNVLDIENDYFHFTLPIDNEDLRYDEETETYEYSDKYVKYWFQLQGK